MIYLLLDIVVLASHTIFTDVETAAKHAKDAVRDITPFAVLTRINECHWRHTSTWSKWSIWCNDEHFCLFPSVTPLFLQPESEKAQKEYEEEKSNWDICETERRLDDGIGKFLGFGWMAGVYDSVSKVLSTSKLNVIVVLLPMVLGLTFAMFAVIKMDGEHFSRIYWAPFLGILAAGVFSYMLKWTLYGCVLIFGAIGYLVSLELAAHVSVETILHIRHLVKEARELREGLAGLTQSKINPPS